MIKLDEGIIFYSAEQVLGLDQKLLSRMLTRDFLTVANLLVTITG